MKKKTKKPTRSRVVTSSTSLRSGVKFSKLQLLIIAVVMAIIGVALYAYSSASTGVASVYRLHSDGNHNYFYTTSADENKALQNYGYSPENVGFVGWSDAQDGRVPVYQLTNNPNGGGQHLFTADAAEKNGLVAGGWKLDKTAFYAYITPAAARIPVYRLLLASTGEHLLTTSDTEKASFVTKGWKVEGVAFYSSNEKPVTNASKPVGAVDVNRCDSIAGWTVDGDNKVASTPVHIYIDGAFYSVDATDVARADVNTANGATGKHGFNWAVPAKYREGKPHTADVYAINIDSTSKPGGDHVLLGRAAWGCGSAAAVGSTTKVEVGMCATSASATAACTKETADAQTAFFKTVSTAASCVGLDGVTMARCTQAVHDQQVAAGTLIEGGCVGQTLDGSNRIDCSASTKHDQEVWFAGMTPHPVATTQTGVPCDDVCMTNLYLAGIDTGDTNSTGEGNGNSASVGLLRSPTGECIIWYHNNSMSAAIPESWKQVSWASFVGNPTEIGCRDHYNNGAAGSIGGGMYNTFTKNHFDWRRS